MVISIHAPNSLKKWIRKRIKEQKDANNCWVMWAYLKRPAIFGDSWCLKSTQKLELH